MKHVSIPAERLLYSIQTNTTVPSWVHYCITCQVALHQRTLHFSRKARALYLYCFLCVLPLVFAAALIWHDTMWQGQWVLHVIHVITWMDFLDERGSKISIKCVVTFSISRCVLLCEEINMLTDWQSDIKCVNISTLEGFQLWSVGSNGSRAHLPLDWSTFVVIMKNAKHNRFVFVLQLGCNCKNISRWRIVKFLKPLLKCFSLQLFEVTIDKRSSGII